MRLKSVDNKHRHKIKVRKNILTDMVFCLSRAIVWLQNKRDVALERSRPPSHRREDQHEFRVGRLKHERVKVPRGDEVSTDRPY